MKNIQVGVALVMFVLAGRASAGTFLGALSNFDAVNDTHDTIHDQDFVYAWSTGAPDKEDGSAFSTFVGTVNGGTFGGANGWRLPTLAELQTIVLDFPCIGAGLGPRCSCLTDPCVDPALDPLNTQSGGHWSATSYLPVPANAWLVVFDSGTVSTSTKVSPGYVRAVRGGL